MIAQVSIPTSESLTRKTIPTTDGDSGRNGKLV